MTRKNHSNQFITGLNQMCAKVFHITLHIPGKYSESALSLVQMCKKIIKKFKFFEITGNLDELAPIVVYPFCWNFTTR